MPRYARKISNAAQLSAAIARVVDYNWRDEEDDYRHHPGETGHIFHDLVALRDWLINSDAR